MAVPRPALACVAALALAAAFAPPLRPHAQLKPVSSTARRRAPTLLRASDDAGRAAQRDARRRVQSRTARGETTRPRPLWPSPTTRRTPTTKSLLRYPQARSSALRGDGAAARPGRREADDYGFAAATPVLRARDGDGDRRRRTVNLMFQLQMTGHGDKNAEYRPSRSTASAVAGFTCRTCPRSCREKMIVVHCHRSRARSRSTSWARRSPSTPTRTWLN